jgi:signal transduction histidine kinase/CheY-like chemotaxis protein
LQKITEKNLANETQTESIRVEQVKMLYESMLSLLLINLAVSSALVYAFWNVVSQSLLILWLALMLAVIGVRAVIYYGYKNNYEKKDTQHYIRFLVLGSLSAGILWGAAGIIMFPPQQVEYQLFILLSLLAMVGGSTFSLSIYLPAYFAFAPLALLPITINLFFIGDSIHITLGAVTLVYLAAMTFFNIKINKNFKESLLLRFENVDLIKELEIQKNEADNANLAKSKFLAAASHDLRQPLYSLGLFTAVLDESTDDPKLKEVVEQIDLSVKSLQEMFDVLLDISQLDAGLISAEISNFSLQPLMTKLSREFTPVAQACGLRIVWPVTSHIVSSETTLLEQILRNYLSNAIRYTDNGVITVSSELVNDKVVVSVADTGQGIPADKHQLIFQEFYQLENPERNRSKGLGLGLSIAKRAADLLNHSVSIESVIGKGSTFSVSLPHANEETLLPVDITEDNVVPDTDSNIFVVVIDDNDSIRAGLKSLLNLWGYKVVVYQDSADAIQGLASQSAVPNVLICDYRLPGEKTGIEVIDSIKSLYGNEISALLITGDTEKQHLQNLDSADAQVLFKPIAPIKLRTFLRTSALKLNTN